MNCVIKGLDLLRARLIPVIFDAHSMESDYHYCLGKHSLRLITSFLKLIWLNKHLTMDLFRLSILLSQYN